MRIVINDCFGKYALSSQAEEALMARGWSEEQAKEASYSCNPTIRSHPDLIQVVIWLGELANGKGAQLRVVKLVNNSNVSWSITNDNGYESVEFGFEPDEGPAFARLTNADKCYDN